ncbi:MAG: hypothetical protein M1833_007188 [Piccolia ochrophora]|nr:MAG: hypothetical protein M1833_007188 [Piccolia ochrophora]
MAIIQQHPYLLASILLGAIYMFVVNRLRFKRVEAIKERYGFGDEPKSFQAMTVEQAQEIEHNLAEWDFPFLYEFSWLFDFLRTGSTPPLSYILAKSGHFVNEDPLVAHRRQQDTICLMSAFMAHPFNSEYNSLALARINVHHSNYPKINSDTVLYVIWHFWRASYIWINRVGWRTLEPFEIHALWVFWREIGVRMGIKYVPYSIPEVERWSEIFRKEQVYPDKFNRIYTDAILNMFLCMVPGFLKPFARNCIVALLDEDVIWACQFEEYVIIPRAILRPALLGVLRGLGLYQRWLCLPRRHPYVRSTTGPNPKTGLFNFPDYTYETTPYYVRPTLRNQWGPWALLNRLRGIAIPGPRYHSEGTSWEAMGAQRPTARLQAENESDVRKLAKILMAADWGYRAPVRFQPRPFVQPLSLGYGSRVNAFPEDVKPLGQEEALKYKAPSDLES